MSNTKELSAQQIAERCADIMWPDDHAARGLGMEIVSVGTISEAKSRADIHGISIT